MESSRDVVVVVTVDSTSFHRLNEVSEDKRSVGRAGIVECEFWGGRRWQRVRDMLKRRRMVW